LEFASKLRPQDCEAKDVMAVARHADSLVDIFGKVSVQKRTSGIEFLVCHELPDAAGTGVVVAHRVRELNKSPDGIARFYVYPSQEKEQVISWADGVLAIRCPVDGFRELVDRMKPSKIEFHHLLRWPLDIITVECPQKELWLHDSFLWCAKYHSVNKDGAVCNEPEIGKCADCSGETAEFLESKKALLNEAVGKLDRFVANSEYTARYAKANLGIDCEVVPPSGEPLSRYGRRKRVGYFGGFGIVKGTPVLLKAWRMLQKAGDHPQLLMFCDVPAEWVKGRKLVGFDDVLVMGSYRRDNLPELCNLVDLAVVPSINESYGLVGRELESLGVPVIRTKAGGMEGTVAPGDAEALVVALQDLLR
jgi:glycosyltransferase involved in cell wall biosynthesis